jgi:hypothetical protein
MLFDHLPPLADILGLSSGQLIGIAIPIAGMALGGAIAITAMYFKHQQRRLWHEMARTALEKGQPIPDFPRDRFMRRDGPGTDLREHDVRGGLVLIAVGFGLYLFLGNMTGGRMSYVGAIPGFIGVALLLNGLIGAWMSKGKNPPADRPPQS